MALNRLELYIVKSPRKHEKHWDKEYFLAYPVMARDGKFDIMWELQDGTFKTSLEGEWYITVKEAWGV